MPHYHPDSLTLHFEVVDLGAGVILVAALGGATSIIALKADFELKAISAYRNEASI